MHTPLRVALFVLCSLGAAPRALRAQPSDGTVFAREGSWVLWFDQGLVWSGGSAVNFARATAGSAASTGLVLRASVDRFVTNWLTAGLVAGGGVNWDEAPGEPTDVSLTGLFGLRVGFAVPIARRSVSWPRVTGLLSKDEDRNGLGFAVHAPFVRQIEPGFLVGFGPAYEFRSDGAAGHRGAAGLLLSFAGVLAGGPERPPDPEGPPERLGEAGQWLLTVKQDFAVFRGTRAYLAQIWEPGRPTTAFQLMGTFDWFAFDHVSIGFAVGVGKVSQLRDNVVFEGTATFYGGQLGGAVPVGSIFTLRPDASILWRTTTPSTMRRMQLFLPLAVELGHFLVGVGPAFEQIDEDGGPRVTVVGLTMLVGGWWR